MKVCIVCNKRVVAEALSRSLEQPGLEIIAVTSASRAIAALRSDLATLLLIDLANLTVEDRFLIVGARLALGAQVVALAESESDTRVRTNDFDAVVSPGKGIDTLREVLRINPTKTEPGVRGNLTPRESEVAALAAVGLTNGQIAARLGVNTYTVKNTLSHVFSKLSVANRAQLAVLLERNE